MIAPSSHQTWLFYSPLAQQAALLKDDLLDPVDLLLDDPALVDLVRQCLAKRSPRSTRTGRRGLAPDRLLRCSVMKHLKGWSFRDLERELRSNLVYRRFTHFDADITPRVHCLQPQLCPAESGRHRRDSDNTASLALAVEVAGYFELDDGKARDIAKQVGKAVSKWRDEAARHGLTKNEIDRMASAFEHDDLKAALAAR